MATRHVFWLLVFLLWPCLSEAVTRYISTTGSDSNSCSTSTSATPANAKRNFNGGSGALACMAASDTLIVHPGTYAEQLATVPSGSSGNHTIVKGLTSTGTSIISNCTTASLYFDTAQTRQFITFQDLVLDGCNKTADDTGAVIGVNSNNFHFLNMEMRFFKRQGMILNGTTHRITGGKYHHNGVDTSLQHGVYMKSPSSIVENAEFYNNASYGFHPYSTTGGLNNNIIRNNKMYSNRHGMFLGVGLNILVHGNLIYNNSFRGVFIGGSNNLDFYNNTLYNNAGCGMAFSKVDQNMEIKNNIFWQHTTAICAPSDGHHATTVISNNITTNPLFVNAGSGDFHLQTGSPAINAGVNLTATVATDFGGTTHTVPMEAGAYNFGTPVGALVLKFSAPPVSTLEDTTMANVVVRVEDSAGALQTGHANNCVIAKASGPGTLAGTLTRAPSGGICTFSGLSINDVGTYTLSVSSTGTTSVTSPSFAITSNLVLRFSTPPVSTLEDTTMANVVVRAENAAGTVQTGHANNCVMVKATGPGTLAGTLTKAPVSGVCTFNDLSINDPGTYTVSVSSTGATSVTSAPFAITDVAPPPPPVTPSTAVRLLRVR